MKKIIYILALFILTSCASKTRVVTFTTEKTSCKKIQIHLTKKEFKTLMKEIELHKTDKRKVEKIK